MRYIRIPAGVTNASYNLRPATSSNVTASNIPATVTSTPVTAGRGQNNPQAAQVKQEPPTQGSTATPRTTSTTTIVRKGKGRGKKTSTVSVLDTTQEMNEYFIEMEEDDLENSDSDATELYEILANMTGPEEEIEMNLEPEMEPHKGYDPETYLPKPRHRRQDLFVNMVTVGSAIGATIPTTFGQTKCNVLIDTRAMKSCMSQVYYQ